MKVLLINGSAHEAGCTFTALSEVAATLNKEGVDTEIFQLGADPIRGCRGCGACRKLGKCAFGDDVVNRLVEKVEGIDGLVIGSPVHYASAGGAITSVLDRLFYAASGKLTHKPCACLVSARRAGTTAALEQLIKYPTYNQMPLVSSQYWPMVHGNTPDEVLRDEEGMQIMRTLGRNMAWLLKAIECGKQAGVCPPERTEAPARTNFIR